MEMIILLAVIIDLILGDPRWMPHPVIGIGKAIRYGEQIIRKLTITPKGLKIGGLFLTIIVVGGTYFLFWGLLYLAFKINIILGTGLSVFWMSQSLAINSLYKHAINVAVPLSKGDLDKARNALAMIVGRDTENLGEAEIARGVIETVAENTVDGITSPLIYGFIGGPPLAMAYKAVNTLDSMIGYMDERYIDLGWAAARLDDIVNYIPARLTGIIYLLIAPFTAGGIKGVWNIIRRDASNHPSPNGGIPESAVAGALEIQLGGVNYYRGVASNRALMGDAKRPLEIKHIYHSLYIMVSVSFLVVGIGMTIYVFV
jgi:adenosylcobinamide-phosphate synthase